jgi:hypothetical protein
LLEQAINVKSVKKAVKLTSKYLSSSESATDEEHFTKLAHSNMIARIEEQVNAMICCLATKNPTGSEVLGRVVLEGSVNLMFLSLKGNEKTIFSFFDLWLNGHKHKLDQMAGEIKGSPYEQTVEYQINERKKLLEICDKYVDTGIKSFGIDRNSIKSLWPTSIFKRFEALEMKQAYYENYHRLSGSSHMTAEDTISWLMSLDFEYEQRLAMSFEALSYSQMMSRFSCYYYVCALFACCISHGLKCENTISQFEKIKEDLLDSAKKLGPKAGVPQPKI